ncbi:MAG: hypothetical protein AAFY64_09605, partial [Pseudomonadota bacterium]
KPQDWSCCSTFSRGCLVLSHCQLRDRLNVVWIRHPFSQVCCRGDGQKRREKNWNSNSNLAVCVHVPSLQALLKHFATELRVLSNAFERPRFRCTAASTWRIGLFFGFFVIGARSCCPLGRITPQNASHNQAF